MRFGDDWWRLWAGKSGAHEWRTTGPSASLGMTNKERVAARKGRLLNRGIFQTSPFSGRVPLDKEKGFVKDEDILSGAEHRFFGHQKRLGASTPGYHR